MKVLVLSMLLTGTVFAAGENLENHKKSVLENLDKRISAINTLKSCIGSASDREAMKSCRKSHQATMKGLKEANKAKRKQMKEARKAKRQAKKKD